MGNLAVVEHFDRAKEIAESQPLQGSGRGNCFDSLDEARTLVKNTGLKVKQELLAIPVLVVEVENDAN